MVWTLFILFWFIILWKYPERCLNVSAKALDFGESLLKKAPSEGEKLLEKVQDLCLIRGPLGTISVLPRYKFYTNLLTQLIEAHRQYGSSLKTPLREIKHSIVKEIQFDKQKEEATILALAQFVLAMVFLWALIAMTFLATPEGISLKGMGCILLLHTLGLGLFVPILKMTSLRFFSPYEKVFGGLYCFHALLSAGVPLEECLERSKLVGSLKALGRGWERIVERTLGLLERLKNWGAPIGEDLSLVIDEIWFNQHEAMVRFQRRIGALKVVFLGVFFLSSYFLVIGELVMGVLK